MKTFAIGDLHGRLDLLQMALDKIESLAEGGTVVFLGDYVDRGPDSAGVVRKLYAGPPDGWKWVCLAGNHEDMMVDPLKSGMWLANGGMETISSYYEDEKEDYKYHIEWMNTLPLLYQDDHRVYVHAYVDEDFSLDNQSSQVLLWERYGKTEDKGYRGKYVVHGHTPFKDGPHVFSKRINLDTGAVWSGRLVIAEFDDMRPGGPVDMHEIKEQEDGQ